MKLSPKIFSFLKFLLFPAKSNNSQQQSVVLSQLQQENTINDFPRTKSADSGKPQHDADNRAFALVAVTSSSISNSQTDKQEYVLVCDKNRILILRSAVTCRGKYLSLRTSCMFDKYQCNQRLKLPLNENRFKFMTTCKHNQHKKMYENKPPLILN